MSCEWLIADPDSLYPVEGSRKPPGDVHGYYFDWTKRLDCDSVGIVISNSTWDVHPDDDDGSVTVTTPTISGLIVGANIGGGMDGKYYRIINEVTGSSGQIHSVTLSIPVLETRSAAA